MRCLTNVYTPAPPPLHNNPYTIMHSVLIPILSRYLTTYALGPTKVPSRYQGQCRQISCRYLYVYSKHRPRFSPHFRKVWTTSTTSPPRVHTSMYTDTEVTVRFRAKHAVLGFTAALRARSETGS